MSRHSTVTVKVGDRSAEIDVALAPLIREMWIADIETMMCCQEAEPGIAWIEFPEVAQLFRFVDLVARFERGADTLYNRITDQLSGPMTAPVWEYQFRLLDIFEGQPEQLVEGYACFDATVGVCFPTSDIPVLLERLQEFNAIAAMSDAAPGDSDHAAS